MIFQRFGSFASIVSHTLRNGRHGDENVYFPCRYSELANGSIRLERSWMEDVSRPDYTEEVSMILDQNGILEIEKFLPTAAQIYPCEYYSLKLERK